MAIPPTSFQTGVLLIENDAAHRTELSQMLRESAQGFRIVAEVGTLGAGLSHVRRPEIHAVLLSLSLPDCPGVDAYDQLHAAARHLPIIVLCPLEEEELALLAVHRGAQEYLIKGTVTSGLLNHALRHAIEKGRAESVLAQERDLLSTLLDNIPDRIYFKDRASRFIRINRTLTTFLGLTRPEEAYGKTDVDFFGEDFAREAMADERRVMETGEPLEGKIEKKRLRSTSQQSWTLTTKLPLRDRTGVIIGTCGISREVTKMVEMEERLHKERTLLRSVINNLPDFVFLTDPQGRYMLANEAYLQAIDAGDAGKVLGHTAQDFYPQEIASRTQEEDQEILQTGQPLVNHEEPRVDQEGNQRWSLMTKVPWRGEDGSILGLVCISRDITEKKSAEERLKNACAEAARSREDVLCAMGKLQTAHQQLREVQIQLIEAEKMKTVGRLAAGVAHEVKNPLAVLKMGMEYLNSLQHADENAKLILHEMSDAAQRADSVIRSLLDFSAPTKLELQPDSVNAALEEAIQQVRTEFKGSYRIIKELQPNLPDVRLDSVKLRQAFFNMLANSIHAMENAGTLSVRTYARQLTGIGSNISSGKSSSFRVGQTIVVVEIEDTGPGIPEEQMTRIFEPFFTTKPTGKGTGLGLSVVKTIIDLHGGTIDLQNRPERGLKVTITLRSSAV